MNARPLKVLLAIEDRQTLSHCARLLTAFGHRVPSAASPELALARLRADCPDVVVVGGDAQQSAIAQWRMAAGGPRRTQVFEILLLEDPTPHDLLKSLEAGVDDVLLLPIEPAELLARVRMAARVLEFERRLAGLAKQEESTGLLYRQTFLERLQDELQAAQRSRQAIACLVLQPDANSELQALHGQPAAAQAMQQLVTQINEGRPHWWCGRVEDHRLALAFPATEEEGDDRAEQLRAAVAQSGFQVGETQVPWTISLGLALSNGEAITAIQLLEHAEKALSLAQQSGGDLVVRYQQVTQEDRRWSELAGGKLFESALLRNFMVAFPRLLRTTDSLRQAEAALEQTRLAALPVVDEDGKLAGLFSADRAGSENDAEAPVTQAMNKEPVSFDEATTLPVLIDYFTREAPPVVVVVHKGRPTGLVTPESLATLVDPLTTASFAPPRESAVRAGLILPHLSVSP